MSPGFVVFVECCCHLGRLFIRDGRPQGPLLHAIAYSGSSSASKMLRIASICLLVSMAGGGSVVSSGAGSSCGADSCGAGSSECDGCRVCGSTSGAGCWICGCAGD